MVIKMLWLLIILRLFIGIAFCYYLIRTVSAARRLGKSLTFKAWQLLVRGKIVFGSAFAAGTVWSLISLADIPRQIKINLDVNGNVPLIVWLGLIVPIVISGAYLLGQRMICFAFKRLQEAREQPIAVVPLAMRASGSVPVEFWAERFDAIESKIDAMMRASGH